MAEIIEFNLTGRWAEKTAQINREAKENNKLWGRCISRLENLATSLTALIDTISYLAVGILIVLGAGRLVNKICKKEYSSLTFTVGLKHILQGIKLAPGILFAPASGFISPSYLSGWYNKPLIKLKEDTGKRIEQVWEHDHFQAKEIITRADTVPLLQEAAKKELAYLKKYEDKFPYKGVTVGERQAQLLKRIDLCEKMKSIRNWATSNYFRDFLRGKAELSTKSLEERLKVYQEIMNEYMPLAINMRSHACSILNGMTNSLVRIGVISDMSNGYTNQMELKEIKLELEREGYSKKLQELKQSLLNRISSESSMLGNFRKFFLSLFKGKNDQTLVTAQYAYNQVKSPEAITKTLIKRKLHLEDQFLQLVMEHLKDGPPGDITNFPMVHIGLLNQDKKEIDDTGWYHNEANEMADMAEIFNEFNGKLLICDGSGPFVDEQGNIHLPFEINFEGGPKTIPIQTFFVNSSVQGHTNKDMTAKEINKKAIKRLKELAEDTPKNNEPKRNKKLKSFFNRKENNKEGAINPKKEIKDILKKGNNTSYTTAFKLIYWFRELNFNISAGCLSAKDRTGFVCACDVILNQVGDKIPEDVQRKFMIEQLAPDKPGVLVVKDNNPETNVMKVEPFFIPLVTDTIKGSLKRIEMWKFQVDEIFKERSRIKEKQKIKKENLSI